MIEYLVAIGLAQSQPPIVTYIPAPPPRSETSDAEFCEIGRRIVARTMAELPMMVDIITRVHGVSIFCSLRTMTWNKFFTVDISAFREGWQERKQAQFNSVVCGNWLFAEMAGRGWRFVQNLTFHSGERVTQSATCPPVSPAR